MAKKRFFVGILGMALVFGMALIGCDNGSTDDNGDGVPDEVKELSSFEGTFVASEQEATTIATGADTQIQLAISAALANGGVNPNILPSIKSATLPDFEIHRAINGLDGHYSYNGIELDYTVTYSDGYPTTYPFTMNMVERVSVNGTYSGYKISGVYNVKVDSSYTSAGAYNMKYNYDCTYTVSYNGKGMKIVTTGEMTMASSPVSYNYDLHYAVYDNGNVRRYNYDYNYSY
jgi:hypothetical protein